MRVSVRVSVCCVSEWRGREAGGGGGGGRRIQN